jgi:hypothetical protein
LSPYCKSCRKTYNANLWSANREAIGERRRANYAAADPREVRIRRRMTSYKIDRELAERIEDTTHCEWCERELTGVRGPDAKHVHHNHKTGQYVATLCGRCNSIEGWVLQVCELSGLDVATYLERIVSRNG